MKGIYCLLIRVRKKQTIKIGALGKINFTKGSYVYVGSGQNNLEKRIARHVSKKKKIRWHIDYLLANKEVIIEKAMFRKATKEEECNIACFLNQFEQPIKGFGCSDCKCSSHLFRLISLKNINKLKLKEAKHLYSN